MKISLILTALKHTTQLHSLHFINAVQPLISKTFFIIPSRNSVPIKQYLPFPSCCTHPHPGDLYSTFCLDDFPFLDTYTSGIMYLFLFLVFTFIIFFKVYSCYGIYQKFL